MMRCDKCNCPFPIDMALQGKDGILCIDCYLEEKDNSCPKCANPLICAHCVGATGGKKSKRKITPEQQAKMQEARKCKSSS